MAVSTSTRTPLGRLGRPEEVAALIRFLCDDGSGFVTGAVVPIDGGQLLGAARSEVTA